MKISVLGFNSFKAVVDDIAAPSNVFYVQSGGNVSSALALLPTGDYVQVRQVNNTTTNFLSEYPAAVEVVTDLTGEF